MPVEQNARRAFLTLTLAFLLLLAPAQASAAIFELTGEEAAEQPDIAVGGDGTAHVVWNLSAGVPGDDVLVYCRVPRGAKACEAQSTHALPKTEFEGPHVVLTRSGAVVLVSKRCCFPGAPVFALTSTDDGQSFGPPVKIADEFSTGPEWEAELGPGDFSISLSGGNSGPDFASIWRAAALDGSSPEPKLELAPFPKAYFTSTGFPSPTNPIAVYSDLHDVFLRMWDGSGDYNDGANWTPEAHVVQGNEPKLVSGPRGVFMIYMGPSAPFQYFVRRFDGSSFPAGAQRTVSDPATRKSAIFRDFLQDEGGNLHAVFRQRSKKSVWGLRHRTSSDGGESWAPIETLATGAQAEDLFNLRVGAAPDGGGAIVGDHNSDGPIWFSPFGPLRASKSCPPTVKLGKATVRALTGCFKKAGKKRVATGPVKVNGVDLEPFGGGGASASAAFKVVATPGQRTLESSGKAQVRVGEVVLERGKVAWKLPAGDGKVVRLGSPDGSVFRDLGKFAKRLFDFPVDGDAELLIAGNGAKIPANFRMPGLIGGVTGFTTLRTNQGGQVLEGMKIDVPNAAIGLLRIAGIDVTYSGADRFAGTAKIKLPPAYSGGIAKTSVSFGFEDGELSLLKVEPPPFEPALPIVGSPPTPIVGLDRIAFAYLRQPGSRVFQGSVFLLGGPKVVGERVAALDGAVTLEFPEAKPTTLKANGDLKVVRLPLASAFATYTVPSTFEFGGGFHVLSISGTVKGFVDLSNGHFSASGSAGVGPLSGEAVMTNSGFGACVHNPLGPDPGVSWDWGDVAPEAGCPGSGAGASASGASAPAPPAVKARVAGKGRRRSLRFRMPAAAGRRVIFAEQSQSVYREIGTTGKARGRLRFRPAPGPGGKRSIVAIVEQDGVPWAKLRVARYTAPPTRRLRRPRVVAKRSGRRLRVSWRRVKGARGYEVTVSLPRDGRRLLFFPSAKKRRLKVKGLERSDTARVTVAAIGPDLKTGRPGRAKLRPVKQRRRHRGRRR
jgi:hypothetical protein